MYMLVFSLIGSLLRIMYILFYVNKLVNLGNEIQVFHCWRRKERRKATIKMNLVVLGLEVCQYELWHLIETDAEIEMCVHVWVNTDISQSPARPEAVMPQ